MDNIFFDLIPFFGGLTNEFISLIEFVIYSCFLLILFRHFNYLGIYAFNVTATIIGNIQVLREAQYFFQSEKIALGTIAIAMTFAGSDIIVEHYGTKIARNSVMITFISHSLFVIGMIIALIYTPYNDAVYNSLISIFVTSPRLLLASLIAYTSSQILDIYLFGFLKRHLNHIRWLWFRSFISVAIAGLLDNIIFSTISLKILAQRDISMHKLIFTYILGTYWFKLFINACTIILVYLSYKVKKTGIK